MMFPNLRPRFLTRGGLLLWALALLTRPASGFDSFSVMSTNLALGEQPGWQIWFNPTDSPEGAFLATLGETETSLSGRVPLGTSLPPGRYFVAFKMYDYNSRGRFTFSLGTSSGSVGSIPSSDSPEWYEFTGWWTAPAPIEVTDDSDTLTLRLERTLPAGTKQRYLFKGVYITQSENVFVYSDDSVFKMTRQFPADASTARPGNLLANASFEAGSGHGWGWREGQTRTAPTTSIWDITTGYDGSASMRVPNLQQLVSRVYRLRANRSYTLSAWVKTGKTGILTLAIEAVSRGETPADYPPLPKLSRAFTVNTSWQRVALTGFLPRYPAGDYQVRISVNDPQGRYTWIDAVQLEEGDLRPFACASPVEVGLASSQANNLFSETEAVRFRLRAHNREASPTTAEIPYEVFDYLNRRVDSGTRTVTIPAQGTWQGDLDLSPKGRGAFRIFLWVAGQDHTREEVVFSVVPEPQNLGVDKDSLMGIHSDVTDFQYAALRKLGFKWNRLSSPSRAFRWSTIEANDNYFSWTTEDLSLGATYGITHLGTLGLTWPKWAEVDGKPDLAKWEEFVDAVVKRYKGMIEYWEVWNEPNWQMPASYYTQMLQRAIAAITRNDPEAKIIALGGVASRIWSADALTPLSADERSRLFALATHLYPKTRAKDYVDYKTQIQDAFGIPVWNTEAGVWGRGFYLGDNSNFLLAHDYAQPSSATDRYVEGTITAATQAAQAFVHQIGTGLSKYFYYDSRTYLGPGYQRGHPTIFEYDDTIRAKGVALAILARLFDHSQGLGDLSPEPTSHAYLFNRGGTPLLAVWANDGQPRRLTLAAPESAYRVYDLMGNPLPLSDGGIPYSLIPVYLEGQGLSIDALRAAVQSGTIASRTDTVPPSLVFITYPTGPTSDEPLRFRWMASDSDSIPSDTAPNAIEYSYWLEGRDETWSPWSPHAVAEYANLGTGSYVLHVRARDLAGNTTSGSIPVTTAGISKVKNVQVTSANP